MDDRVLDVGATVTGTTLGVDQIFNAISDLMIDGATGSEWLALGKGFALMVFGFFAWHRKRVVQPH